LSKKLHILFLCSWYPSKVLPTNGDFIQRHAEAVSLLHTVSVLHIVSNKNVLKSNIEEHFSTNLKTYIGYVKYTKNPLLKLIRFFKMYTSILKKVGFYDVIHLHVLFPFGIFALHQKYFKNKSFIISEHWTGYLLPQAKNISFVEKQLSKIISKKASFISPVSSHLKFSMQQLGLTGNYFPVPNVVDTALFKPVSKKEDQFTIVHVSSLKNDHKNIFGMLKAAKILESKLGEFTWNFIGGNGGEFKNEIKNLEFSSANIHFIDHVSQEELAPFIQKAHVFVLFSNYENLPCVILESFSCGTPVISSDIGGISEYFPESFGSLVSANNIDELVEKITETHNKPINKSEEMHTYVIENFSKETIAKLLSELYTKTLNRNH
jgi:L-malate glycosyltransferase